MKIIYSVHQLMNLKEIYYKIKESMLRFRQFKLNIMKEYSIKKSPKRLNTRHQFKLKQKCKKQPKSPPTTTMKSLKLTIIFNLKKSNQAYTHH
jgi:hypothetical protein